MNIIFFNDTGNVIFKCIFSEEDHIGFFDRRVMSYLKEKEIPSLPNIQKISYFYVFFFPSKELYCVVFILFRNYYSNKGFTNYSSLTFSYL